MVTQLDEIALEYKNQAAEGETKKMASGLHSAIIVRLGWRLGPFVDERKLGYVLESSATYNFKDNPPKRQPDLSFISLEKMPTLPDEELTLVPDLVVEVVSKNDTFYEVEKKVQHYQQVGVKLIWVIHPVSQTVGVYRLVNGLLPQVIGIAGELDGEDVLPGFKLPVRTLFM
jgi:Uma2 family endonuclease